MSNDSNECGYRRSSHKERALENRDGRRKKKRTCYSAVSTTRPTVTTLAVRDEGSCQWVSRIERLIGQTALEANQKELEELDEDIEMIHEASSCTVEQVAQDVVPNKIVPLDSVSFGAGSASLTPAQDFWHFHQNPVSPEQVQTLTIKRAHQSTRT